MFTTPEAAADDFVSKVLEVPPNLGPFVGGDSRSGEIAVLSSDEGSGEPAVRSTLLLRQLGPSDGWFVIAAVGDPNVTIAKPVGGATVPAAPLTLEGLGRGYEATIIVKVFAAGASTPLIEPVIAMGGALETPLPYSADVDLSRAAPGSTVLILVRGDTGLETDPGEFSAIAVRIG
ncbi:MAG: hypothetical protein ACOYL9_08225 [Ilumatobacteraceae bacterium]